MAAYATSGQVLHGLAVSGFHFAEHRLPRGLVLERHEHERACVNFVLEGVLNERCRDRSANHAPGTLVFKPPREPHTNRLDETGARCLLLEVDASAPSAQGERLPVLCNVSALRDPRLSALAWKMCQELRRPDDYSPLVLEGLALELLACASRIGGRERARDALSRVDDLLAESVAQRWTLRDLAQRVGLHPSHLARAFRRRHGCTVGEYQRLLRVSQVARLLDSSDAPLSVIAQQAGFADQSHCTRMFRRCLGTTPGEWRRLRR